MKCKKCGVQDSECRIFYPRKQLCVNCYKKDYYKNNKEHINQYYTKYRRDRKEVDKIYATTIIIRNAIYDSLRRSNHLSLKSQKNTTDILGCSIEYFHDYISNLFKEGMSWDNYGKWELDHIVPISSALNEGDVIRLNHYTNFQPLWKVDNQSKGCRLF